jgi:hypothetical protein
LVEVKGFRAIGCVSDSRFHSPGKFHEPEFGFPKDDNKITSALTYEGIAGRRKIRPDRIAKRVD